MAVTLSAAQLAAALKITTPDAAETDVLMRLKKAVCAHVERWAPLAPDAILTEAAVRMAGYLYDAPTASDGGAYASAFEHSGAAALLAPWRTHRAGLVTP